LQLPIAGSILPCLMRKHLPFLLAGLGGAVLLGYPYFLMVGTMGLASYHSQPLTLLQQLEKALLVIALAYPIAYACCLAMSIRRWRRGAVREATLWSAVPLCYLIIVATAIVYDYVR
jgi:hypothetical protein